GHRLLVIGLDDAACTLFVLDNDREGVQVLPRAAFDASWSSAAFPQPVAYRYYDLEWPAVLPPLAPALPHALAQTVHALDGGGTPFVAAEQFAGAGGVGLPGLARFVAEITAWPQHFTREELAQALRAVYLYVEKAGTGFGGFFRGLYGRGLVEGATLVPDATQANRYRHAGAHYEALGSAWTTFAAACRAAAPGVAADPAATLRPLAAQAAGLLVQERAGRDLLAALAQESAGV
ncbi:MAG TPA: DUF4872 domain-containing protein, partial [Chloroflexia bacterium]|nr:DUF4872 domain-containing protein [Chloroflexia bacterium]